MNNIPEFIPADELSLYLLREELVLLDVRDQQAFNKHHLPNAISMTPDQLVSEMNRLDENKHYVIICYHGIMAVSIAQFMQDHDFSVSVLQGGMAALEKA